MSYKLLLVGLAFLLISTGAVAAEAPTKEAEATEETETTKEAEDTTEDAAKEDATDVVKDDAEDVAEDTTVEEVTLDAAEDTTTGDDSENTAEEKIPETEDVAENVAEVKGEAENVAEAENKQPLAPIGPPAPTLSEVTLRTIKAADAVINAEFLQSLLFSSKLEFTIKEVLRGELSVGKKIVVDFARASYALWPKAGDTLLCLCYDKSSSSWELAGHTSAIIGTDLIADVKTALQNASSIAEASEKPNYTDEELAARKRMGNATTVLLGKIEAPEVDEEAEASKAAAPFMSFLAEEAIVGFNGFYEPIKIATPESGALLPGTYVLFLRGAMDGDYFVLADTDPVVALNQDAPEDVPEIAEIKTILADIKIRLCTPQATFVEYQNAWNERDLPRLISTFSPQNPFRLQYKQGGDARKQLLDQIESFPARINLSIKEVNIELPKGDGTQIARIDGALTVLLPEENQKSSVQLVLTNLDGNWLITSEGF